MRRLTERQFREWEAYYDDEPWGEERADWRSEAFQLRLMKRCWGGEGLAPAAVWPYFAELAEAMDPERIERETRNFEEAIEPDGKGGYRWKPGRGPQEVNANVDDHRQT